MAQGAPRRTHDGVIVAVVVAAAVLVAAVVSCALGTLFLVSLSTGRFDVHGHPAPPPAARAIVVAECQRTWADWVARRETVALRELTVRIIADEEFRAAKGEHWRDDVRARVDRASAFFERELRISLRVVDVEEWESDDAAPDMQVIHRTVTIDWVRDDADFVLAFTSQHEGRGSTDYDRGVSYYFGRSNTVRVGMPGTAKPWPYEDETVLHELLHSFGAWHVDDSASLMRSDKSGSQVTTLDALNAANALLTRELDFRQGPDAISPGAWETITRRWRHAWRWDVGHPGLDAYGQMAAVELARHRPEEARAAARRGVDLARRFAIDNPDEFLLRTAAGK